MHLVALLHRPADPAGAVQALMDASGMVAAEARMRIAPDPPALIARLPPEAALALVERLREQGLAALAVDEAVPRDGERTVGRTLVLGPSSLAVTPRSGPPLEIDWPAITVLLRATSTVRSYTDVTETSRKFSMAPAIATGGLVTTRNVETIKRDERVDSEQSIYVYAGDGSRAVLREQVVDFSCLGASRQPGRVANMTELARQLRARAPQAAYDDRLLRMGKRPLPFALAGETRIATEDVSVTRSSNAASVDVLAEVLRRAFEEQLLP